MHDDEALKRFLVAPIQEAEVQNDLTKAERAVLRRSIHHLSNNSRNGYSLQRDLSSYRRSLRLLQNVLDTNGANMLMSHAIESHPDTSSDLGIYPYAVVIYYPKDLSNPDFTCKTNADVQKAGGAYSAHTIPSLAILGEENPTIQWVMERLRAEGSFDYSTVTIDGKPYVSEFTIQGKKVTANLSNQCYDLKKHPEADKVFWFYSVNGTPGQGSLPFRKEEDGKDGQSFADFQLKPFDVVFWQLIAPDAKYGFLPCLAPASEAGQE